MRSGYLDEDSNAVQPDIIVVLKENESIIKDLNYPNLVPILYTTF